MAIDLDPADYALFWRKPARRKGMLVAICGFDGTGKTTQVERLQGTLEGRGVTVTRTRQPTDWYRNEPVVKSYLAHGTAADGRLLTLLSAADRRRNIVEVVDPALAAGGTVICDRYVFSTLAFNVERGVDGIARSDDYACTGSRAPQPIYPVAVSCPASLPYGGVTYGARQDTLFSVKDPKAKSTGRLQTQEARSICTQVIGSSRARRICRAERR